MSESVSLTGMTQAELRQFMGEMGERPFRGDQLFSWIHQHGAANFDEMTNLSKGLRTALQTSARLEVPEIVDISSSSETASRKYLFELSDGLKIESVLIPEGGRRTVCLSSQVGCPLDCKFCATAKMGFLRNLTSGEMVGQLLAVRREVKERISNVVFMGMGEPFLNYDNVMRAAYLFNDKNGLNIGARKITISTVGMANRIRQFSQEKHPFKLAFSLNATEEAQRSHLMPINDKHSLAECLDALKTYTETSRKRATLEYVLMAGTNDSPADARRLSSILNQLNCKLNVIPYNPISGESFQRPDEVELRRFTAGVMGTRSMVTVRWSQGKDINAACGQLYSENERRTVRRRTRVSV